LVVNNFVYTVFHTAETEITPEILGSPLSRALACACVKLEVE